MIIKTNEIDGAALDWAVAKCEDYPLGIWYDEDGLPMVRDDDVPEWKPSTDWAQGAPIIEREGISVLHTTMRPSHVWEASHTPDDDLSVCEFGPTLLIAAMRCYVASKLGDSVNVPDELVKEARN